MPEEKEGLKIGGIRVSKKLSTLIGTYVALRFDDGGLPPVEVDSLIERAQANLPLLILVGIYLLSQGAVDVAKALKG